MFHGALRFRYCSVSLKKKQGRGLVVLVVRSQKVLLDFACLGCATCTTAGSMCEQITRVFQETGCLVLQMPLEWQADYDTIVGAVREWGSEMSHARREMLSMSADFQSITTETVDKCSLQFSLADLTSDHPVLDLDAVIPDLARYMRDLVPALFNLAAVRCVLRPTVADLTKEDETILFVRILKALASVSATPHAHTDSGCLTVLPLDGLGDASSGFVPVANLPVFSSPPSHAPATTTIERKWLASRRPGQTVLLMAGEGLASQWTHIAQPSAADTVPPPVVHHVDARLIARNGSARITMPVQYRIGGTSGASGGERGGGTAGAPPGSGVEGGTVGSRLQMKCMSFS